MRGEYLYTANGADGFEVFDVANIDQKGFSERIVTAPVSPLGQRTYVRTKYATSVTLPSTLGIDPLRTHQPENEEQPISLIYAWVFITDREEGLVMGSVGTLRGRKSGQQLFRQGKNHPLQPGWQTHRRDAHVHGRNKSLCRRQKWIVRPRIEQYGIGRPTMVGN